jgi:hypothetical protein
MLKLTLRGLNKTSTNIPLGGALRLSSIVIPRGYMDQSHILLLSTKCGEQHLNRIELLLYFSRALFKHPPIKPL